MRVGIYLLLSLSLTWQAHSFSDPDVGSGAGPVPTRGSSVAAKTEGSGAGGGAGDLLPDDEDNGPSSTAVSTTTITATSTATSAAAAAATRGLTVSGPEEPGSGAGTVRLQCDSSRQCFCVDEQGREIPNTRGRTSCVPVDEEVIFPLVASTYGARASPSPSSPAVSSSTASTHRAVNSEEPEIIDIDASPSFEPPSVTQVPSSSSSSSSSVSTQPSTAAATTSAATARAALSTTGRPSTGRALAANRQTSQPSTTKTAPVPSTTTTELSNLIPVDPTFGPAGREEDNLIGDAVPLSRGESSEPDSSLHPGLLAAIIGGGVVGLLCAILLIMFIVYRMRKKDEGSYPLDDGKPRMAYAAKSSSNKEFYA